MIVLISQIVGCLLVAAGIGGMTGWFLRRLSVSTLNQHIADLTTTVKIKEQALHWAQLELKAQASTVESYESTLASSEALARSAQQELASCTEQLRAVQEALSSATQRLSTLESEQQASLQRYHDSDATIAAYAQEARQANAGYTAAQQELNVKEQELLELQNRLTEADPSLVELERLHAQVAEMEPAQGRVHWLEVQLCEKDSQHRTALHESGKRHAAQLATIQEEVHATLAERDRAIIEKDQRIAALQRQFNELRALQSDMASQATAMGKKKKEGSPLHKPLVEVRSALTLRPEDKPGSFQALDQPASQLHLQIGQPKPAIEPKKDDLKKIPGIGPVIEDVLNKMGTYTYIQIAMWKPSDIAKVAKKLDTLPDRIKPDNWVARAKKQHREKYGERL
jgi:predicted flap endonuclease-1-like 5' DNA nuclease